MSNSKRTIMLGLCLIMVAGLLVAATGATTCYTKARKCYLTLNLENYTDEPTIPCMVGNRVVKITASAKCKGKIQNPAGPAGPVTIYRCANFSNGFQFTGNSITHYVGVSGGTWGDVLDGKCSAVTYSTDA